MSALAALALAAAAYYLLALVAALLWPRLTAGARAGTLEPVSILKPVHGRDPGFYEAIRSHAVQDYPQFEILFGVENESDSAVPDIRRLADQFPERAIRLIVSSAKAPNGKVARLAELAAEARYPLLVINDSDVRVPPDYLRCAVAPLADARVGLATCLYRAAGDNFATRWEALGVATEFAPSVMVARLIGMGGFALGSTMALRASVLRESGGFAALRDYLADDYQLGLRVARLGYRVVFARTVVETRLGGKSWGDVWRHQLRWSRTIRVSRTAGYFGYLVTHATLWGLAAIAAGAWKIGAAALVLRLAAGLAIGWGVLGDRTVLTRFPLIPFRDLWGFAVWLWGLAGGTVEWRGQRLKLSRDGKIRPV